MYMHLHMHDYVQYVDQYNVYIYIYVYIYICILYLIACDCVGNPSPLHITLSHLAPTMILNPSLKKSFQKIIWSA